MTLMTREESIIEMSRWLATPAGRYLLRWEQLQLDQELGNVFGYHALQLGLPELDALRANRMPHRWLALDSMIEPPGAALASAPPDPPVQPCTEPPSSVADGPAVDGGLGRIALRCDFDALPLGGASVDLLVLPHTLELSRDPHLTLREVERVLVPEGRVVIIGFNPASLWGARQRMAQARARLGWGAGQAFMPRAGEPIGYWRLRDWLRLLSFEVEYGRFGCWRPPLRNQQWLSRFEWIERVGQSWWPVFGALYFVVAVKRVRGMRLLGLARRERLRTKAKSSPAVATQRQPSKVE